MDVVFPAKVPVSAVSVTIASNLESTPSGGCDSKVFPPIDGFVSSIYIVSPSACTHEVSGSAGQAGLDSPKEQPISTLPTIKASREADVEGLTMWAVVGNYARLFKETVALEEIGTPIGHVSCAFLF